MKILYGYPYFPSRGYDNSQEIALRYLDRIRKAGFDVEPFCLTIDPPNGRLTFPEIDIRWKLGERKLLGMYERLEAALEGKDVLINAAGINLHPEFVESLKVFTVYGCNDDPESSADLSKPVAAAYDLSLVGNIAEVETYKSWGVKHAEWRPLGLMPEIYDSTLTEEQILNGERDIDLFMMIDKNFPVRKQRLETLDRAFPNAEFYGSGWKRGILPENQQLSYLKRAKIGPNVHNSTGPINFRTFYLPANGVMQICDNKSHLGKIYELNREAVGFDRIEDCIELCKYYLNHDEERRKIAAAGWKRAVTDYNEVAIFKRDVGIIRSLIDQKQKKSVQADVLTLQFRKTRMIRPLYAFVYLSDRIKHFAFRVKRKLRTIWSA